MGRRATLDRRSSLVAMASPSEPAPAAGRSRREMLMNKATAATGRGVVTLDHADLPTMVKDRKRKAAAMEEEARVNAAVAQAEATAEAERAAAAASAAAPELDLADAYGLSSTGLDNPYGAAVSSVAEQATAAMSMGYGLGIGLPDQRIDLPAAALPLPLPQQPLPPTQAIPAAAVAAAVALESGPVVSEATLASIFEQSNKLKPADRQLVAAFVGDENAVPVDGRNVVQVVLHEQRTPGTTPQTVDVERLVFEMTFAPHGWRRLRQRRTMKLKT